MTHATDSASGTPHDDEAHTSQDTDGHLGTEIQSNTRRDAIREKVDRLYDLVPAIGTRWRWYDIPYRFLHWLLSSWRRKLLPWRTRRALNRAINFLLAFEHYERSKVESLDDPMDNLIVPEGEEISQGGIWIVEFFPPSHYAGLHKALRNNGWDREAYLTRVDGTNAEQIARARHGTGFTWSRLGYVTSPSSGYRALDAKTETLPKEFEFIELTATQIGRSLTAVVAFVRLSKLGEKSLDVAWKKQREPTLHWRGLRRPDVQGRLFASFRATQDERQRIHDLARDWLRQRCGGFFAGTEPGQPAIDFTLFSQYDPTSESEFKAMRDPLRALGLDENYLFNYVSPQIPGAVIVPPSRLSSHVNRHNYWGVIGSSSRVSALNNRPGYGEKPFATTTLAAMLDDAIRAVALYVSVLAYLDELRRTYAIAIDRARSRHRRYSSRRLEQLRSELLATSLDLPVVARDVATLWDSRWRSWNRVDLFAEPAPGVHPPTPEKRDLIEEYGRRTEQGFSDLLREDDVYREVLATVSSLGASAEANRLGRRALITAFGSLLVAVVALLVANTGGETLWSEFVEWITR